MFVTFTQRAKFDIKYIKGNITGVIMFGLTGLECFSTYILLSLIFWAFAGYAYRVNNQLPADDPKKRDFHPVAVHMAPITWPIFVVFYIFLLIGYAVLFVIKALLYGIFLILFTLALVFIRKPFLLIWLEKIARKTGNMLLTANTALIKLIQFPWVGEPQPT